MMNLDKYCSTQDGVSHHEQNTLFALPTFRRPRVPPVF
jgi:hypothetical protein